MIQLLKNKSVITLIGLLMLGVLIGSLHGRSRDAGRPFVVMNLLDSALYPVQAAGHAVRSSAATALRIGRPRKSILKENAELRKRVRELEMENASLKEGAEESIQLRDTLRLSQNLPINTVAAEVISREESTWFDTLVINKGRRSGIKAGSAVVNHLGLIGQVEEAGTHTSKVVALTDPLSAVGGMVRRSRACGLLRGQGADNILLTYLPKDADVKRNDIIVTSGMGQVIPKGFVVGRVLRVVRDSTTGTTSAVVRPSVKFEQAEYVLIVAGQGGSLQ